MDPFDILRQGCAFGRTNKSKSVPPSKKHDDGPLDTEVSHLDFFGYGQHSALGNAKTDPEEKQVHGAATREAIAEPSKVKSEKQRKEELRALQRRNRIKVSAGAPAPVTSFDELPSLGVPGWIVTNLRRLGFSKLTPIQMQCIPAALGGNNVLASAPTGSGKTMAFLVPILVLLKKPVKKFARAVVIAPTRELSKQIVNEFEKLTMGEKEWIGRGLNHAFDDPAIIEHIDVLVSTPLRLVELLQEKVISLDCARHLILDEADKLLDLGFAPQIDEMLSFCPKKDGKLLQTMLFSATLPRAVCDLANSILTAPIRISVGADNAAALDVTQKLMFVSNEDGKLFTFRQLVVLGELKPPVLIFVQSKERAKQLFGELSYDGIYADTLHGDRTQEERDEIVKGFENGQVWMLICTDLMARGIDFRRVEVVINFDFPQSASTYIHRVGRTGRAGRRGVAITFFTIEDFQALRTIVGVMRVSGCDVPEWMLRLNKRQGREKRMAEFRQPFRKHISTIPKQDLQREQKEVARKKRSKKRTKAKNTHSNNGQEEKLGSQVLKSKRKRAKVMKESLPDEARKRKCSEVGRSPTVKRKKARAKSKKADGTER